MTRGDFEQWLERYGEAWKSGSPDAAVQLFSADARYHETPFEEPMIGRNAIHAYWTMGAQDGQTAVSFSATIVAFEGPEGFAHWQAEFTQVPSGRRVRLDGVLSARFDDDDKCITFREWWHRHEM